MENIKHYLEGYCKKHECSETEAKTHAMVRNVEEYYKHVNDGKIGLIKIDAGCDGAELGADCK